MIGVGKPEGEASMTAWANWVTVVAMLGGSEGGRSKVGRLLLPELVTDAAEGDVIVVVGMMVVSSRSSSSSSEQLVDQNQESGGQRQASAAGCASSKSVGCIAGTRVTCLSGWQSTTPVRSPSNVHPSTNQLTDGGPTTPTKRPPDPGRIGCQSTKI